MTFEEQVEKGLEGLSKEQQIAFAWRCGVRALPFLGSQGNFNFWKGKTKQEYLLNVFRALDYASIFSKGDHLLDATDNYVEDTEYVSATAIGAENAAKAADYAEADDDAADDAAAAAYYASYASAYASVSAYYGSTYTSTFSSAYEAATHAAEAYVASYAVKDITRIILEDIEGIKEKNVPEISIKTYSKVWINFQKALQNEGCDYWANWYEQLFKNNFEFDLEEVKQRLDLPKEIKSQGAAAVAAEMERILREGSERLNEARVIILGDKGVGKTCIARKLRNPKAPMTKKNESTPGVDTTLWKLKTEEEFINVRIWDFAGHTVTHAAHQFFLSERSLYILVYDGRSEERNRLRYWLDHVKNYGGTNSKAIILVNEQDKHTVDIPINTLKSEYPIEGLYSFNIKSDTKDLAQFRKTVSNYIIHNPSWEKQQVSKSYYQVKNELENLFVKNIAKDNEFIQKKQFLEIAKKHSIKDEDAETLLKSLHALGISLWYPKLGTYNTLILNPEWISDGVYKIINWVNNQDSHAILLNKFSRVFEGEEKRFPKEKHTFLFDLMIEYELAYTLNKKRLVIPHLLDEDQPKRLPKFENDDSLLLRYETNQILPSNTISRFIVRHHANIKVINKKPQVWRYGVILEDESGSIALVQENDRAISVSVQGKNKTAYISKIRETLNDIFNTYKSLQPELSYKVIDSGLPANHERFLEEQSIVSHLKNNRPFYDPIANLDILLDKVAKDYNINLSITINNQPNIIRDNQTVVTGGSIGDITTTNFNFQNCNLELQGGLSELIEKLSKTKHQEDLEDLKKTAKILEEVEDEKDKEIIKKKLKKNNIPKRIGRFFEELGDKKSDLSKTISGLGKGVEMVQDIAKYYNNIAEWVGLPVVPKVFLKKK